MATAIHHHHVDHRSASDPLMKEKADIIPEFIEERRKDSEGRINVNKFSIGKLLGKGGFAKCYQGTLLISNQQYALKIVAKSTLVKPKSKQKLQTEIKIHRVLRHTYVCKFERFFEDNNNVYMLLELCGNNSMSDLLKKRKKLTEPEVRYYIAQLISSLKYLHENLVIHRDLKLGNLFLDSQMRIKVGDFGLATKIADVNERRKTFCGTPNYIAPEVLQGKNGHSFEVDVWSTGVIMYTLLVGKPPFDSKDIKTTYEKILANNFNFPDSQQSVCEHSKSLIRSILQTKPAARPKLDAILDHPFYTKSGAFTPTQLPESAMREPPSFSVQRFSGDVIEEKKVHLGFEVQYGDENDPQNANRIRAPSIVPRQKGYILESKDAFVRPRPVNASGAQSGMELHSRQNRDVGEIGVLTTRLIASTAPAPSPASGTVTVLPGVLAKGTFTATPNCFSMLSAPPQKKERLTTTPGVIDRHSYSSKFDIYQDSKAHLLEKVQVEAFPVSAPIVKQHQLAPGKITHHVIYPVEKPREVMIHSSKGIGAHRTYEHGGNGRGVITSSSSAAVIKPDAASEIDILQSELEWFRLGSASTGQSSSGLQPSTCTAAALRHKSLMTAAAASRSAADAWSEDDLNVLKHFAAPPPIVTPAYCSPPQLTSDRVNIGHLQPCTDSEPMNLSPPSAQIIVPNEYKALGTLETMHEVLASKGLDDLPLQGQGFEAGPINRVFDRPQVHSHHKANIWVVRYVDYTSKYGLGFLLNTGSAGVYFNDSTKIVVSPDGSVFQYSERRRKEKGSTSSEHSIQTHSVNRYPAELQKKVTLLRHFRNYLVDQQKEGASRGDDGSAAGGREDLENIAIAALEGASSGANALVPFGASSTILRANDAIQMGCCFSSPGSVSVDAEPKMPFLKKWVRTRHAILFRLSNRTVQVLFFDRSEVLLSSEARMVTYVSKQNIRSEHSLEEVLQAGRTDIAKRLKYAKDIMYRLISTQAS